MTFCAPFSFFIKNIGILFFVLMFIAPAAFSAPEVNKSPFIATRQNAEKFHSAINATSKVLNAVLKRGNAETLLIPDHFFVNGTDIANRVNKNRYSPHNSGADLYPHLVITSSFINPAIYQGRMMEMLRNEIRFTNVKDGVPGTYSFDNKSVGRMSLFSGAEYIKDGVVPITEFLGRTPWFDRMIEITRGVMQNGKVKSRFGFLPANDSELNGDMLQAFSRIVPMTADPQMLEWARRIADAYIEEALPGTHGLVPTKWDFTRHTGNQKLRLRDHGNETLVGLVMMAAIEQALQSERAPRYIAAIRIMLDRILESANPDGLLYNVIDAKTLAPETPELADNWGYVYSAVYTFYMMTGETKYRDASIKVLSNLSKYAGHSWEGEHYDGIADSVESALYLLAREPIASAFEFVEYEMARMLAQQKPTGHIDESYLEGNFNRTTIQYMMYKSQGLLPVAWNAGIGIGAEKDGENLRFSIIARKHLSKRLPTHQKIRFDSERHRRFLNLPKNFPRVNEFPEWFTVKENQLYELSRVGDKKPIIRLGSELINGVELAVGDWTAKPYVPPVVILEKEKFSRP